ncbi:MAG: RidA family protein [Bacteroidetes bacterium]|nr:RidA family protein [Bacteroidota bacterium]
MNQERRSSFKKFAAGIAGLFGLTATAAAAAEDVMPEVSTGEVIHNQEIPLFSSSRTFGNLVFIAGKGAHFDGDIKAHTKHVLDEIQKELEKAGSSMNQVLKANVYLNDLKDYQAMNEVFRGRFGANPPVRTTIAAAAGIPGDSLVEIDCIAYVDGKKKK